MKKFTGFECGMGIGGWLTNYKRFNVLPEEWKLPLTAGDYEHFDTYITEDDVRRIKEAGFDHIRLGFDQIVLEESPYVYREKMMNKLVEFSVWCENAGLNLVLNLHKCVGNYCDIEEEITLFDSEELQNRVVALWLAIEKLFHNRSGVAFELLNEVRDVDGEKWNDLAERLIQKIRAVNPTRLIIVGSTTWNDVSTLKDLRLYEDENVVYTFHTYFPFEFTHQQGVLQARTLYYNRKLSYPSEDVSRYADYHKLLGSENPYVGYDRIDKTVLKDQMQPAFDFVKSHPDKILWCGEFGTIRHADRSSRMNWMRDVISLLKENGIPYCVWNYLSTPNDGNRFSLVDDDTREFLSDEYLKVLLGKD